MLPTSIRKKRIACDNCHFSKVRCTGETSGCQRCERGARVCRYSESNMGRRKQSSDDARNALDAFASVTAAVQQQERQERQQQRQGQGWEASDAFDMDRVDEDGQPQHQQDEHEEQPSTASIDRRPEGTDLPLDESLSAWDEDHSDEHQQQPPFSSLLFDTLSGGLPATPRFDPLASSFDDMDFSAMDQGPFDVGETTLSLAPARHPHVQATNLAPTPQTTARAREPQRQKQLQLQLPHQQTTPVQMFGTPSSSTTPSYQASSVGLSQTTPLSISTAGSSPVGGGMRYWTTQLAELSRIQPRSPVPLDVMLQQSSQLLPQVTEALRSMQSTGDTSSTASILILMLVCLTQVVALVEQVIPSVLEGHPGEASGGTANLSLRLGAFQIDREDQQALQMHLVSKELSSMLQVSNLIRQTLLQPEWRCVSKRTHNLLLEDLQARTKTLVYQMRQKRGTTARVLVL